ncbi:hypothetical protein D7X96_29940 [Corallococcus interemptor]|uniref:Uncharacterized protein n=1 Tax=Corallococcus interemptor TaxID=2316720 RepID=A0A3A8Q4B0_9BACT|nr:hypothetical protein [Corallococcus interemptor]RKH62311.1 hypothetical protein D7X96_29940 [Corallococcus interemptor]
MTGTGGQPKRDPFWTHAGLAAAVMGVGAAVAAALPKVTEDRVSALLGVGIATVTGVLALVLKRRAVSQADLKAALKVVGVVFALRGVGVGLGLAWVVSRGLSAIAFVGGFFGVYFALQWIEVSYVMAASKDTAGGDE